MYDNIYPNRHDKRKQYFKKCERVDRTCRPHGSCPWCRDSRLFKFKRNKAIAESKIKEYFDDNLQEGQSI